MEELKRREVGSRELHNQAAHHIQLARASVHPMLCARVYHDFLQPAI